ncbi:peroxiredoxin [Suillus subalutaceus]|uniref:peroxiredoxin n=1 Tax=Suillus subalutaceus TaxID=48586 RepID=UPI001B86D4FA|nr:peroxiredoxin [Suillus subalutaceus]KAG1871763.1 peroxiredoxin [Suillus subalutaceus]
MAVFVQRPAPAFTATAVVEGEFKETSLSEYLGQWVILFFYPMDFTFVCPTEILAFNDALPQFKALNASVLGVSTDSQYSHFAWAQQPRKQGGIGPDLRLPLIADRNMTISKDYGVLIEEEGIALRGLFIIDPKGIVRQITINDLPVGRSVEETIRLLQAFQFVVCFSFFGCRNVSLHLLQEANGEVCPLGWTEGDKTIKPDPKGSMDYFSTVDDSAINGHANGSAKKRLRTD